MRDSPVIEDDDDDDFSKVPSPKSVRSIFVVGIILNFVFRHKNSNSKQTNNQQRKSHLQQRLVSSSSEIQYK